ncbi:MAG: hypothetical protein U0694_28195 [Anaerolineae bacterium]
MHSSQHPDAVGDKRNDRWLAILRADGWTLAGPHGRPNENQ